MANLGSVKFTLLNSEYRPCKVNGVKAIFHRWSDKDDMYVRIPEFVKYEDAVAVKKRIDELHFLPNGSSIEKACKTVAIVEFPDGHIKEVDPTSIEFQDTGDLIYDSDTLRTFFYPEEYDDYQKDI